MAVFPALEPATRSYRQGRYSVTRQGVFGADAVRFLHDARPFGYVLQLGYAYLTAAEAQLIRDHWRTQGGGFEPFTLSPEVMAGHGTYDLVPATRRWRYTAPPEEQHLTGSLVNVSVELETVTGVWVLGAGFTITASIVTGAASAQAAAATLTVTTTLEAGAADAEAAAATLTVTTTLDAGAADAEATAAELTVTTTLEAGAATGD